jgi:hypothetical protein
MIDKKYVAIKENLQKEMGSCDELLLQCKQMNITSKPMENVSLIKEI